MTLDQWLTIATRGLAKKSVDRVRAEIAEHAQSALDSGHDPVLALGDPQAANRAYRKVLLTSYEEHYLRTVPNLKTANRDRRLVIIGAVLAITFAAMQDPSYVAILAPRLLALVPPSLIGLKPALAKRMRVVRWCAGILSIALACWSANPKYILPISLLLLAAKLEHFRASIRRKVANDQLPPQLSV
jgi:hypothetical protein